jgi:hypothetical protein
MTEEDHTDIVARLRGAWLPSDTLSVIRDEAADEIERLRKERDAMMLFVRGVADDVNALSTRPRDSIGFGDLVNTIQTWGDNANEIERLTRERDNARRMVCCSLYTDKTMQLKHAQLCGWDCFTNDPMDKLAQLDKELGL